MKKIISLALPIVIFCSCEKKEVKPPQAPRVREKLFNWKIEGFASQRTETTPYTDKYGNTVYFYNVTKLDSCSFYHNGKFINQFTNGYHQEWQTGDTITFYLKGLRDLYPKCGLMIWQDKNELPINYNYFPAKIDSVITYKYLTTDSLSTVNPPASSHAGKHRLDSIPIKRAYGTIKGYFVVRE